MKFWLISVPLYLALLALGLGLPALVVWKRQPLSWIDLLIYLLATGLLVVAALVLCIIVARRLFPQYWWIGQVQGKDVFEFEGVYFRGLRLTGLDRRSRRRAEAAGNRGAALQPRLQRVLFGVDQQMRNWDLVLGLLFLVLLIPHTLGFISTHRTLERILPNPAKFPESLHYPLLSSLPVMREWGVQWSTDSGFTRRIEAALQELRAGDMAESGKRFRFAQLQLLKAFTKRARTSDPFYASPGERIYFNRGQGAAAVESLQVLLALPELQRAGWSGGALALIGFFHLSDRNYPEAAEYLRQALAELGEGDESSISRYHVLLLAAQSAMLSGDREGAMERLELILVDDRLPKQAYALAMEHYAEALRLKGEGARAPELLTKAMELYKLAKDRGGLARVHLRLAALALDEGRSEEASHELSIASSLAHGLEDEFTLNMVERLTLAFSG